MASITFLTEGVVFFRQRPLAIKIQAQVIMYSKYFPVRRRQYGDAAGWLQRRQCGDALSTEYRNIIATFMCLTSRKRAQGCRKGVVRWSDGCTKGVERVQKGCWKGFEGVLKGCKRGVVRGVFKGVMWVQRKTRGVSLV